MHKRQLTIIGTILIAATILFAAVSFHQQAQDKSIPQQDEPTQIQEGIMTEKQRKHSKLYNRTVSKSKILTSGTENVRRIIGAPFITENSLEEPLTSQKTSFKKIACQSGTIIVGEIKSKNSQLSEDSNSIFTDYEIVVEDVIKDKSFSNVQLDKDITITRSGGAVKINNRIIEVVDKSYKTLSVGRTYLFFLNYLSNSDSFMAAAVEGTFEVYGGEIKRLNDADSHYEQAGKNLVNTVDDVHQVAQQCFQKED